MPVRNQLTSQHPVSSLQYSMRKLASCELYSDLMKQTKLPLDMELPMLFSIKNSLMAMFGLMAVLAFGQGAASYLSLSSIHNRVIDITTNWMPSVDTLDQIQTAIADDRVLGYRYMTAENEAQRAEALKRFAVLDGRMQSLTTTYVPMIASPEEQALYDSFQAKWKLMKASWFRAMELAGADKPSAMALFRGELRDHYDAAAEILNQDVALNRRGAEAAVKAAMDAEAQALLATWLTLGVAAACALGAMSFTFFRVSRPIDSMTATMTVLAEGDTAVEVPGRQRRDEVGAMASAVQVFKDNLIRTRQLEHETALSRASAEEQRKAALRGMADAFERAVGRIVGLVSASAAELQTTARQMTGCPSSDDLGHSAVFRSGGSGPSGVRG